jgi:hypothetical protein
MMAGSDIAKGCASSLTETVSRAESRASSARRVGSASAANVWSRSRSRAPSLYLTIRFSIAAAGKESRLNESRLGSLLSSDKDLDRA